MNRRFVTIALAFSMFPTASLAQSTGAPPISLEQRQALHQTFEQFREQQTRLGEQFRSQVLSSLTVEHRRAVAATIGEFAVAPDPDVWAAAKRLNQILSPAERTRIMQAQEAFRAQSSQLREQLDSVWIGSCRISRCQITL